MEADLLSLTDEVINGLDRDGTFSYLVLNKYLSD